MEKNRILEEIKRDTQNIDHLLNDFGNYVLVNGLKTRDSNEVASAVNSYLNKERLKTITEYLNIKYKDVWRELAKS